MFSVPPFISHQINLLCRVPIVEVVSASIINRLYSVFNFSFFLCLQLVDMHGGGELIRWMRYARKVGDYSFVDAYFEVRVGSIPYISLVYILYGL